MSTNNQQQEVKSGCPVPHDAKGNIPSDHPFLKQHQQQQQQHNFNDTSSTYQHQNTNTNTIKGGCPVPHDARGTIPADHSILKQQQQQQSQPHNIPITIPSSISSSSSTSTTNNNKVLTEPPDTKDRVINPLASAKGCPVSHQMPIVTQTPESSDPKDAVPPIAIPAAGRGNSEDGHHWLNPSANQLFRALRRKDKPIDIHDATSVADVHTAVTTQSWNNVLEYEQLHSHECANPSLARFQGMDGIYSIKAKVFHALGWANLPFDRHDWTVDRCGKEVRYIIDYYANEEDGNIEYYIDARPAPTPAGIYDRLRVWYNKWKQGDKTY